MKSNEKRRRNRTLSIRLTENEKRRILNNSRRAGLNITDYLTALSLETPINAAEDVKPMLIELKCIGNNPNQISAKINAGVFTSYNFQDLIDGQKKIFAALLELVRKNNGVT